MNIVSEYHTMRRTIVRLSYRGLSTYLPADGPTWLALAAHPGAAFGPESGLDRACGGLRQTGPFNSSLACRLDGASPSWRGAEYVFRTVVGGARSAAGRPGKGADYAANNPSNQCS